MRSAEALALMQHHGAPTRLLDWTYSPYVATYFAMERPPKESAALWRINISWCRKAAVGVLKRSKVKGAELIEIMHHTPEDTAAENRLILDTELPFVSPLNVFYLNERLTVQRGLFMAQGDLGRAFEENLRGCAGWDKAKNVLKVVLDPCMWEEAICELHRMNIHRATLFPGLDGFASSLGVFHPIVHKRAR